MSKLVVPARLEKAAKELINNTKIRLGCSQELKDVIWNAKQQKVCMTYDVNGHKKVMDFSIECPQIAYCLPDNIEIVVQEESKVPQWIKDKFSVCEVKEVGIHKFCIIYPNKSEVLTTELPAALRCDGWVHQGWLVDGCNEIIAITSGWVKMGAFYESIHQSSYEGKIKVTAYASVWEKVGK